MFGYVTANKEELKVKELDRYRSFYCGLCHALSRRFGKMGQLTLNYDLTFVAVLLNALYETPLETRTQLCLLHPVKRKSIQKNSIMDYAADMCLLLSYYKMLDDLQDDRSVKAAAFVRTMKKKERLLSELYPLQTGEIKRNLRLLAEAEARAETDIDLVAGYSGAILGAVLLYRQDEWRDILVRMGFYLGKYVYLLDAYDDLRKDRKKGRYNPWTGLVNRKDFDAFVENTLMMMISDCAREFEKLPIVQDVELLRNILYSGAWMRYEQVRARYEKKEEGKT